MAEMIVALVARKVGEQVLDGVIDVFLCRDELVISVLWRLPVLFRALLGGLRRGEHGVGRQHVKGIGRGGLFAAHGVGLDGYVGLYAQDYIAYVLVCVYALNVAKGFVQGFWQLLVILSVMNLIDRFWVDGYWVGHTNAWEIPGTEDLKPYITAKDKGKKWLFGTVGMTVISAALAAIMSVFIHLRRYLYEI